MKTILLFGAGKSATTLIDYLGKCCAKYDWRLIVCDADLSLAQAKVAGKPSAKAISINATDEAERGQLIASADVVISMLPAQLHYLVATDCIRLGKHLLTASYIDQHIKDMNEEVKNKGLLFLGEMGLDPGIDHMSAMKLINEIKEEGGIIDMFYSHCGGLVSPESDDNPWHYKITWNPRNVVTAGSAGALFLEDGEQVRIPYSDIFKDENNKVAIPALGELAWYANRDSLSYIKLYGLSDVQTFIRTTLRYPAFCRGWQRLVDLQLTDTVDEQLITQFSRFDEWFEFKRKSATVKNGETGEFGQEINNQLDYLQLRNSDPLPAGAVTSADILQYRLEQNLKMKPHDKDMIVMLHEIGYTLNGKRQEIRSCLIAKGEDQVHTSMAKTVGLPLGIAAKLLLTGELTVRGVHVPVIQDIYNPVLAELATNGIRFNEEKKVIG